MFGKLLIANRGEIAVRVIRACRELGIESVAVYSSADRLAPHVLLADSAVPIGPAPATESYLSVSTLLDAARRTGAEAIHPGYGFLAENADFAEAVDEAGLVFVGPSAAAIREMGDKTAARARMSAAGVPVIPGSEAVGDLDTASRAAARIGYPVLLKAAAGGGGKGMRVVNDERSLATALSAARAEAGGAFSDDRVYLERFLERPRHIEVQIVADSHDRVIHLGERECSIQRRHQKLIEEAPSPVVDPSLRQRMGAVAVAAAEAVGYEGAGTVEFLFEAGEFYFLEMNTRIQVEHPVTEAVTGVDLVQAQIRIAAGEPLDARPLPGWPLGHAIECRISAEDPSAGFLPSAGRVEGLRVPGGAGVRWESGIAEHLEVGLDYDPLLAKLIAHAHTRDEAIDRMTVALNELEVIGIPTTTPFHRAVMRDDDFRAGELSIRFVEEHPELLDRPASSADVQAAVLAAALLEEERRQSPRAAAEAGSGVHAQVNGARLSAWQRRLMES
jgi:acetyl-CoA carboxylase biotin carboxylase subunit